MRPRSRWPLLAVGWLLVAGAMVQADEPPPWHPWRLREWPGRLYIGTNRREHTFERAGYPNETSRFAYPSNTHRYYGYYVGGGGVRNGSDLPTSQSEGTWGWDYGGLFCRLKPFIMLKFNDRYQGGYGSYKIDGKPVEDIGPYVEKLKEGPTAIHEIRGKKHE